MPLAGASTSVEDGVSPHRTSTAGAVSGEEWRDRALRLQAEMENFQKRQRRLADERIDAERERLLRALLSVMDNLERALSAPGSSDDPLREGVQLTYRAASQLLDKEGVEKINADYEEFDPHWHEAVATVRHDTTGIEPNRIVQTMEQGYRIEDRLLRPAKVVVAV